MKKVGKKEEGRRMRNEHEGKKLQDLNKQSNKEKSANKQRKVKKRERDRKKKKKKNLTSILPVK